MARWRALAAGFALAAGLTGGLRGDDEAGMLEVFATVAPHADLVKRVGGDRVKVNVLVGPGQDPHHFSITPNQALALSKSRIYFMAGMPFEAGQSERIKASHPGLELVYLGKGLELRELEDHDHDHGEHAEGEEGDAHAGHDHELDPHIWLSPPLLKAQAGTISEVLSDADPASAATYAANLAKLSGQLDALHEELETMLEPMRGATFYVFHPAFGYFAESYGLTQKAVETGGRKPSPKQLLELIRQARADQVRTLFSQPGFDQTAAKRIAEEIGGSVVELDPLAPDLLANLRRIGTTLAETSGAK